MTAHSSQSPEDRFNDYLDAIASGPSASDAGVFSVVANAAPSILVDAARELHELSRAAEARQGDPPEHIWETIMNTGAESSAIRSLPTNPRTMPPKPAISPSPASERTPSGRSRRKPRQVGGWINAVAAAVLLLGIAAGWYFSGIGPGGPGRGGDDERFAALPAMQSGTPVATPGVAVNPTRMIVISGSPSQARIEGDLAIATLSEDSATGLTLPVVNGDPVRFGFVTQIDPIGAGVPGKALVTSTGGNQSVIDLATGHVLFHVPTSEMWTRDYGSYRFMPNNDELTDWTIVDLTTGDTLRLEELFNIPNDVVVMPVPHANAYGGDVPVFEVQRGSVQDMDFTPTSNSVFTFAIPGSLAHAVALPDYPSTLDSVGQPVIVANGDGSLLAHETRTDDGKRISVVDTETGREIAGYGGETLEDPVLGAFLSDDTLIVSAGSSVYALYPAAKGPEVDKITTVAEFEGPVDQLLVHAASGSSYVRQGDTLWRGDAGSGVFTEVATDLVLGQRIDFTKPGSDWILAQAHDGHMLIDAHTGKIVSRLKAPANLAQLLEPGEGSPQNSDADGDTVIFALATESTPRGMENATPAVWIVSSNSPQELEIVAPDNAQLFWLSGDGSTLYAITSENQAGPGEVWSTPLDKEPAWTRVAEGVDLTASRPLDLDG